MRTMFKVVFFAILSASLVGTAAMASPASAPLGVIIQADRAQVGADVTAGGATIYDGDRLVTGTGGALRAQLGGLSQMVLRSETVAQVHGLPNGFSTELGAGSVVISSNQGQAFQVLKPSSAIIRPVGTQATVAQVTRVNAHEVLLTSTSWPSRNHDGRR